LTERLAFSRPAELPGVEILRADGTSRLWRALHETYAVCAVLALEGELEWRCRGEAHRARGGRHLLLMAPGDVHAVTRAGAPADLRVLFLPPRAVEAAAAAIGLPRPPAWRAPQVEDAEAFGALAELCAALDDGALAAERPARFARCLRALVERCGGRAPGPRAPASAPVRVARAIIDRRFAEEIPLEELAREAGASRFRLVRAFTREVGLPPHAYQIQARLARARALLRAGTPAGAAALETGFADQSHFIRHFRRSSGITPEAFVRA
jgi:AraC-like DNA-binding protein